jgi:hypothetical protein
VADDPDAQSSATPAHADRAFSTSFRMYNAGPRAAAAWRTLFGRVFADLALDIRIIEHGWPDPIDALWQRPDLCGAFMCGWPFVRSARAIQPIAAPVPSPPRYAGLPRYCSEFLVRADSGWTSLAQTFGHRFGWMAADSQSGFNAPPRLPRLVRHRRAIDPLCRSAGAARCAGDGARCAARRHGRRDRTRTAATSTSAAATSPSARGPRDRRRHAVDAAFRCSSPAGVEPDVVDALRRSCRAAPRCVVCAAARDVLLHVRGRTCRPMRS